MSSYLQQALERKLYNKNKQELEKLLTIIDKTVRVLNNKLEVFS